MAGIWDIVASLDSETQQRIDIGLLRMTLTAVGLNTIEYPQGREYLEQSFGREFTEEELDDLISMLTNMFNDPTTAVQSGVTCEFVFKLAEIRLIDEPTFRTMLGI